MFQVAVIDILEEAGQATVEEFQQKYGKGCAIFLFGDVGKQEVMEGEKEHWNPRVVMVPTLSSLVKPEVATTEKHWELNNLRYRQWQLRFTWNRLIYVS